MSNRIFANAMWALCVVGLSLSLYVLVREAINPQPRKCGCRDQCGAIDDGAREPILLGLERRRVRERGELAEQAPAPAPEP